MRCKTVFFISCVSFLCLITTVIVAQQSATEAPTGFSTPTVTQNPGSQSTSNGIPEPPGDTYAQDQAQFERIHDPSTGLGPLFNAGSCAQCHQNGVTGAAGQITELRVGHLDANGNFMNSTVLINNGLTSITGRSIVNDRAICDVAQEHVPYTETIQARPKDVTSVCKITTDPEDTPDTIGMADNDHFAQFIRGTMAPPRDTVLAQTPDAQIGAQLFQDIGCSICHVTTMVTAAPGTVINGGTYTVSAALGNKIIHPFGDFLLHDIGTGDGIVQAGPVNTANRSKA